MHPEWQGPLRPEPEAPADEGAPRFEYQVDDFVGTPIEDLSSGRIKIESLPPIGAAVALQIQLGPRVEPQTPLRRNLKREADLYGLARSLQLLAVYVLGLTGLVLFQARDWQWGRLGAEDFMPFGVALVFSASLFELGRRLRRLSEGARWLAMMMSLGQIVLALGLALAIQGAAIVVAIVVAALAVLNIWALIGDTELRMFGQNYRALVAQSEIPVSPLSSVVYWANVLFFTALACIATAALSMPIIH